MSPTTHSVVESMLPFLVPGGMQKLSPGTNISPQGPFNYASAMMPPPTF